MPITDEPEVRAERTDEPEVRAERPEVVAGAPGHPEGARPSRRRLDPNRRESLSRHGTALGSTAAALLGLTGVVLSVLALSGLLTLQLAAVAVIVVGAALLAESASLAARSLRGASDDARAMVLGGAGVDTLAGVAAVLFGVLALFGVEPWMLLPIAVLALGAGLLFSGATAILERVRTLVARERLEGPEDVVAAVAGVHLLVGAAALVLGILGVLAGAPVLLTLIATISVGASLMLSGAAVGASVAVATARASA